MMRKLWRGAPARSAAAWGVSSRRGQRLACEASKRREVSAARSHASSTCPDAPSSSSSSSALDRRSASSTGASRRPSLRIAVDIDEVLAQFLAQLNVFYAQEFGTRFSLEHYSKYYFAPVWGVHDDKSNAIVHAFFETALFRDIEPVPGALEACRRLKDDLGCDLVVVTSRQNAVRTQTIEWVSRHFPEIFSDLHMCNHFALEGDVVAKSDVCKRIGAHVLIDDNPGYALDCASEGVPSLLFDWDGKYPWSKDGRTQGEELITTVASWREVEDAVAKILAAQQANSPKLPSV